MTVRINKQKINLREKLTEFEDKVNFDEVVRGLGENTAPLILNKDGGNVGIGTTNPGAKLDVNDNTATDNAWNILAKFTPDVDDQPAEVGIHIQSYPSSTTVADRRAGIQSADNAGNARPLLLNKDGGNVGIGTAIPGQKLVVESDQADWATKLINTNASPSGLAIQFTADIANASNDFIRCFKNTSDIRFRVYSNGTLRANATEYPSDDRVKHNEQPIIGALETLSKITPKKYIKTTEMYDADHDFELDADGNPIDENGEPVEHRIEAGVIAQQVLTVDELAFAVSPEGVGEDGVAISPHGLDYNSLFTYAIAAIQEQQSVIEDLKSRIETLESK